jgi:transcriptional regulator with GAF, ATPase, and Fis domain
MASELFGHTKGAFTGATGDKVGLIRQASGGTIYLDEIGELTPEVCATLLRFLQINEIQPVGGDIECIDVRILAATNAPVEAIRQDVLYRFDQVIRLPPLRERRRDIPTLAVQFFASAKAKAGKVSLRLPQEELERFVTSECDWPGNVRLLEKAVLRAVMLHKGSRNLTAAEVLKQVQQVQNPG